jgi:hypothetical protein
MIYDIEIRHNPVFDLHLFTKDFCRKRKQARPTKDAADARICWPAQHECPRRKKGWIVQAQCPLASKRVLMELLFPNIVVLSHESAFVDAPGTFAHPKLRRLQECCVSRARFNEHCKIAGLIIQHFGL